MSKKRLQPQPNPSELRFSTVSGFSEALALTRNAPYFVQHRAAFAHAADNKVVARPDKQAAMVHARRRDAKIEPGIVADRIRY